MSKYDVKAALLTVAGGCLIVGAFALGLRQGKTATYFIGVGLTALAGTTEQGST
jgi:hypothetical protein